MSTKPYLVVASLLVTLSMSTSSMADVTYLEADFDDKTIDAPIGTGGAAAGEPAEVDPTITAIVRDTPMTTPCLELQDGDDFAAGRARFEFSSNEEITTGLVVMTCNLWFFGWNDGYNFGIDVRENDGSAFAFMSLRFNAVGSITHFDQNSQTMVVGVYETGRPLSLQMSFDMDADTYDVVIDGVLVINDEEHGITERGVGSVAFGSQDDPDLNGRFCVDDILVCDTYPSPVRPVTWGGIKALF
jgi:hypothetical protein